MCRRFQVQYLTSPGEADKNSFKGTILSVPWTSPVACTDHYKAWLHFFLDKATLASGNSPASIAAEAGEVAVFDLSQGRGLGGHGESKEGEVL